MGERAIASQTSWRRLLMLSAMASPMTASLVLLAVAMALHRLGYRLPSHQSKPFWWVMTGYAVAPILMAIGQGAIAMSGAPPSIRGTLRWRFAIAVILSAPWLLLLVAAFGRHAGSLAY